MDNDFIFWDDLLRARVLDGQGRSPLPAQEKLTDRVLVAYTRYFEVMFLFRAHFDAIVIKCDVSERGRETLAGIVCALILNARNLQSQRAHLTDIVVGNNYETFQQ